MEENQKVNVVIENYTGEKPIEIVWREGEAARQAEPLATKAPIKTNISGVLSTPFDWLEKRVSEINQKHANIQVDREKLTITLTTEEADEYMKGTVKGTLEYSEVYQALGINDSQTGWTPLKLGQYLRLHRSIFANKEDNMTLVSKLKNFTAHAKSEIQKQKDPSGSMANVYKQEVESNLPKSFDIVIPVFKGTQPVAISVEFDHYIMDGEAMLQLVSAGANEIAVEYRDSQLDEVLEKIRNIAPDIAILEV